MESLNDIYKVTMYYDYYEYECGDGFYPFFENIDNLYKSTELFFVYRNNSWYQIKGINIKGLDGNTGNELIELLNINGNKNGLSIYNNLGNKVNK